MHTADFDYALPPERIAQTPAAARDASRLLVLHRAARTIAHHQFTELPSFLRPDDLLVMNNSRVIPARLRATKIPTGSAIEILLAEENSANDWWVMLRPGKRVRPGTVLALPDSILATVIEKNAEGLYRLEFKGAPDILAAAENFGEIPLPPYIRRDGTPNDLDRERYQTVFAHERGVGDYVRRLIRSGVATAVHDLSDGGLAVGLAEMAMASGIGASVNALKDVDPIPVFFGEDQGRYLVTIKDLPDIADFSAFMAGVRDAGIFAPWIGTTGGAALTLGDARPIPVGALRTVHESWFPNYMNGTV